MITKVNITDSSVIQSIQDSLNLTNLGEDLAPYIPAMKGVIHIAYRDSNNSLVSTPWNSWSTSRDDAEGIVVMEGEHRIMIALDEATLYWSSKAGSGGATTTTSKDTADADFNGKSNTAAIVSSSSFEADGTSYAPGFCHAYSKGQTAAGSWFLPSLGHLGMIWRHFEQINAALGRVKGATKLSRVYYWSSTEFSSSIAWYLNMGNGYRWISSKTTNQGRVRPVAAF